MKSAYAILLCVMFAPSLNAQSALHVNPTIRCGDIFERVQLSSTDLEDNEALIAFCDEVKLTFLNSELSSAEADSIYSDIEQVLKIYDGSFGMPSPDNPPVLPVVFQDRVALKKLPSGRIQIYFWHVGCGMNYVTAVLHYNDNDLPTVKDTKRMRFSYPC